MSRARRVVIRADASHRIGHGHVMRCVTLATALRARGAEVLFVCREHPGHLCDVVESQGFAIERLPRTVATEPDVPAWLGDSAEADAVATTAAAARFGAVDWLVADHYAIDTAWEQAARPAGSRLMVIDDLADRPHGCDLLLDQNYVVGLHARYDGLVPDSCTRLLGPAFAMIQREYATLHDMVRPRDGAVDRVLIAFGGADRHNLAGRALGAALSLERSALHVDVVLSRGSQHAEALASMATGRAGVTVHHAVASLAPLIEAADIAIGASGATSWERLCLGLPSLVVTLADNQRPIAAALDSEGYVQWLGDEPAVDESAIATALQRVMVAGLDPSWSRRCLALVDGRGADRVATVLTFDARTPLRARPAGAGDEALLLEWANDRATRGNSFAPDPISAESHGAWFGARIRDTDGCRLYLLETICGVPVGQVRFDRGDEGWIIDYAVAPALRGRGAGRHLLEVATAELRHSVPEAAVVGVVKRDNVASNRVFASLGFRRAESELGVVWTQPGRSR